MPKPSSTDEFLTVGYVADLLKINPQTVYNWIERGELAAVRAGARRVRIRRADLDEFLAAAATPAPDREKPPEQPPTNARGSLSMALDRARDALGGDDDAQLIAALRELAEAAHGLAQALDEQDG